MCIIAIVSGSAPHCGLRHQTDVIYGNVNLIRRDRQIYYVYGRMGMTPDNLDNTLLLDKYSMTAPARLSSTCSEGPV